MQQSSTHAVVSELEGNVELIGCPEERETVCNGNMNTSIVVDYFVWQLKVYFVGEIFSTCHCENFFSVILVTLVTDIYVVGD